MVYGILGPGQVLDGRAFLVPIPKYVLPAGPISTSFYKICELHDLSFLCSCNLHWDHAELGRYAKYYLIANVHTWKTAMQLHALIFCNHILPPTHETSLIENTVRLQVDNEL